MNDRLSRAEQIKYSTILVAPWSSETGELTPTLKMRRKPILDRYAADIDRLYAR